MISDCERYPIDGDLDRERPEQLQQRVDTWATDLQPATSPGCAGSADEYEIQSQALVDIGTSIELHEVKRQNSYWALGDPGDVARVEDHTFICSADASDALKRRPFRTARRPNTLGDVSTP